MEEIRQILDKYKNGTICADDACRDLESLYFMDIGHTVIDTDRKKRTGSNEVIYCRGKTPDQISDIIRTMVSRGADILGTGMSRVVFESIRSDFPEACYNNDASLFIIKNNRSEKQGKGYVVVVSAGTSDYAVAEEAAVTAEFYGNEVKRVKDAGVAGIHRLFRSLDVIQKARVVIAVAGMEGALASVVGGLVSSPVIAVPTSVGYGASLNGLSALLSMLNSCSSGVSVVNIDNGFGAGYLASMINSM